jgi:hypothetical protein
VDDRGRFPRDGQAHPELGRGCSTRTLIAFAMVLSLTPRRRPIAESLSPSWWRARGTGGEPAGRVGLHRPPSQAPELDFLDETRPEAGKTVAAGRFLCLFEAQFSPHYPQKTAKRPEIALRASAL